MSPLVAEFLGAVVRWLLTALGAVLVARGVITDDQAGRFVIASVPHVVAILIVAVSLAWSLWHKWWSDLKLRAARDLPAGADDADLLDRMRALARSPR